MNNTSSSNGKPSEHIQMKTINENPPDVNRIPSQLNEIAKSLTINPSSKQDPAPKVLPSSHNPSPIKETPSNLNIMAHSITKIKPYGISSIRGKGEEIFRCNDVHVYFIKPDQNVATRSKSSTLRIVTIPLEQQDLVSEHPQPPAFLEAGGWIYPLIPSKSPVYRSPEGYYIFPNLLLDSSGTSVGLILPNSLASDERETFEMMLLNLIGRESFSNPPASESGYASAFISAAQEPVPNSSGRENPKEAEYSLGQKTSHLCTKIATGLMAVAEGASRGLSIGVMKTVELFDKGTELVKSQLPPVTQPIQIEIEIKDAMAVMKNYSGQAVELSALLISKLGEATSALGSYAAYHCQSKATELAVKYGGQSESNTKDCIDGIFEISEGALNAIGMIYSGLHQAARTLANSLTSNTVDVVEYCYGAAAGEIAEIAADTVGNVTIVGLNVISVKPKKVLCKAAKDTGRAMFVKASDSPELSINNIKL